MMSKIKRHKGRG